MISQEVVEAQARPDDSRGKNEARRLRAAGRVPGVVYGAKKETIAVSLDPKQISRILQSESGHNTIFDLQVGGEKAKVMIVDWQYEPMYGKLLHIDLKRIAMDERIRVSVPIQPPRRRCQPPGVWHGAAGVGPAARRQAEVHYR